MIDDFEIGGRTLIYTDDSPIVWTTMAGMPLKIHNQTTTNLAFVFEYSDGKTQELSAAAGGASEPFSLQEKSIDSVDVRAQGQALGDVKVPVGPTVKHMSKGGGNYQRFDWATGCAMLNVSYLDRLMESDLAGWETGRDANYTFEMLMHHALAADDPSFTITVSAHYSNPGRARARLFWRVDAVGDLSLTSAMNEAAWFTRTTSVPFNIIHGDRYLARREVRGDYPRLYFDTDQQAALSITPTNVKWVYPRERRDAR